MTSAVHIRSNHILDEDMEKNLSKEIKNNLFPLLSTLYKLNYFVRYSSRHVVHKRMVFDSEVAN